MKRFYTFELGLDWPLLLVAALLIGIIAAPLTSCKMQDPPPKAAAPSDDAIEAMFSDGPPGQEVSIETYKLLTQWAKDYPAIRPAILDAINDDGVVTNSEYDEISTEEQAFAETAGQKEIEVQTKPFRQALKKAATT